MKRFISNAQAEARAEERIVDYERRFGELVAPPVPVEQLIDHVFNLGILWEPITTEGGLLPAAALRPAKRLIVVNEGRREEFAAHPEYLHFAYGHELGHWDLHVDQATLDHPAFLADGFESAAAFQRHRTPGGDVVVLKSRFHALRQKGYSKEEVYGAFLEATRDLDDFFEARQVNRYAATLLMPKRLLLQEARRRDLLQWSSLYELAEGFQVSITAMKIRLETLGLIYVAEDRTIHKSKAEYFGQRTLF